MANEMTKERCAKIAACYEEYDTPYRLDPFKKIHWGVIKAWHDKGCVIQHVDGKYGAVISEVKTNRMVKDFTSTEVVRMAKGDHECLAYFYKPGHLDDLLEFLEPYDDRLWLVRINQENPANKPVLARLKAKFISARVAGVGSDMYGIYFVGDRAMPKPGPFDLLCYGKMGVRIQNHQAVATKLINSGPEFEVTSRGLRYGGPKKTWTRVVVRNAGEDRESAEHQIKSHVIFKSCPELLRVLEQLAPYRDIDAMMLTRVLGSGGCIVRHTDIALDRDVGSIRGFADGMTMRIHIVVQSNPSCMFHIWNLDGSKVSVNMESGSVWYADVRKPHAVTNELDVDRIHLVTDIFTSEALCRKIRETVPSLTLFSK